MLANHFPMCVSGFSLLLVNVGSLTMLLSALWKDGQQMMPSLVICRRMTAAQGGLLRTEDQLEVTAVVVTARSLCSLPCGFKPLASFISFSSHNLSMSCLCYLHFIDEDPRPEWLVNLPRLHT